MAASDIEVVNRSLTLLGVDPVNSLSDPTKAASTARRLYDDSRAAVFRAHPWNCLVRRVALPLDVTTPAYEYTYQFVLPADFLRLLTLEDVNGRYSIESRRILYDGDNLKIKYIALLTDVPSYDTLLVDALAARLAADMAHPLLQSSTTMEQMWQLYELKLREAKFVDAQENSQEVLDADYWLNSRFGIADSRLGVPPRW
jgi:hypothetical protein